MVTEAEFITPEEFLDESGLLEQWQREGAEWTIHYAFREAGFESRRIRRIPEHRLIIADGDRVRAGEFQPERLIKARVLRSFRERGLAVRPEFYCFRATRTKLTVSICILGMGS